MPVTNNFTIALINHRWFNDDSDDDIAFRMFLLSSQRCGYS
jgi:hypothetical protein